MQGHAQTYNADDQITGGYGYAFACDGDGSGVTYQANAFSYDPDVIRLVEVNHFTP